MRYNTSLDVHKITGSSYKFSRSADRNSLNSENLISFEINHTDDAEEAQETAASNNIDALMDNFFMETGGIDIYSPNDFSARRSSRKQENTFILKDKAQLDSLLAKYNENISKLADKDKKYYQGFIDRYNKTAQTAPFEKNIDAKKLFLALKKLDKYNYDTSAVPKNSNRINEDTEMLGQYSNDYKHMKDIMNNNPKYKKSMENFYRQLYGSDISSYVCLKGDNKAKAKELASEMLNEEAAKYRDKLENLYETAPEYFGSCTYTYCTDNEANNWSEHVIITGDLDKDDAYLPQELVILHELYHVKQSEPGRNEDNDHFAELGAALDSVIKSDEIHKKINNIPLNETVEYSRSFTSPDGRKTNIGEIANKFREIMQKNNFQNWEQVFASDEGRALIEKLF